MSGLKKTENPNMGGGTTRRKFFKTASAMVAAGIPVPFMNNISDHFTIMGWSQPIPANPMDGKLGLRVLSDRPWNAETPATLLDSEITPISRHFVRNNGLVPKRALEKNLDGWSLVVNGEVSRPLKLNMDALRRKYSKTKAALVIECGGNGRAGYHPPASGNQWTIGAVGCAEYEGVRLRDVLEDAGVKNSAVYVAYESEDIHLSRDPKKQAISRGVPIEKALDPHTLLVWSMNGKPLPAIHGFPLRLVCPGWPGSTSGKWLKRIWVRNQVHDGAKMTGSSYRVPKNPVAPGTKVPDEDLEIIEEMPVKSLITRPGSGVEIVNKCSLPIRGHAWSGSGSVREVHLSIDFGATWIKAGLKKPRNKYAWQRWNSLVEFRSKGYFEVWARATDDTGRMQPMLVPGWNPKGYLNNAMHRIAVKVS